VAVAVVAGTPVAVAAGTPVPMAVAEEAVVGVGEVAGGQEPEPEPGRELGTTRSLSSPCRSWRRLGCQPSAVPLGQRLIGLGLRSERSSGSRLFVDRVYR
jgi:hypothetical protein